MPIPFGFGFCPKNGHSRNLCPRGFASSFVPHALISRIRSGPSLFASYFAAFPFADVVYCGSVFAPLPRCASRPPITQAWVFALTFQTTRVAFLDRVMAPLLGIAISFVEGD
jgi:hypothetical protein